MNYNHVKFEREQFNLNQINESNRRLYETPEGKKYPSVTTVLAEHSRQGIMEWRNRIGHAEAQAITQKAATRGTNLHKLCETYLNNEEPVFKTPLQRELFTSIKPFLHNINNIQCLESRLYSDYLRLAGTVDCIGEYNGKLSVIDFKSSGKIKKKEYIHNYFIFNSITSTFSKHFKIFFYRFSTIFLLFKQKATGNSRTQVKTSHVAK